MNSLFDKARFIFRKARKLVPPLPKAKIIAPDFLPEQPALNKALLIVCSRTFDQNLLNAETLMRLGFAGGWAKECGPAKLVPIYEIIHEIELHDNPAVFMSIYDFTEITYAEAKILRKTDLFVWASPHPRMIRKYTQKILGANEMPDSEVWLSSYGKIITAEPKFLWNATGATGMEWFQGWIDDGFHWETIYPAANLSRYFPDPAPDRFGQIKIAYVGGYWPEKAQAFDLYLRPWEEILYPFGYAVWPYKNYGGKLDEQRERQLYSSAGLIPLITGPAGWILAEITERYIKAPACHAFCISDENPALREIFLPEEMLQAKNSGHFHQLVHDMLAGKIDTDAWAEKAYRAVLTRHTYAHRALQIRDVLKYQPTISKL